MIDSNILNELEKLICRERIFLNEPMKNHTTFKIGGPADVLIKPQNTDELKKIILFINENKIEHMVIGNGSNLIVKDGGINGIVIKLAENFNNINVNNNEDGTYLLTASTGAMLSTVSKIAYNNELTGFEFASGIPGTAGGAVTMNAGAYGGQISDILKSCLVMDDQGNISRLSKEDMQYGYRKSIIQGKQYIALEAEFILKKGVKETIKATMDELTAKRKTKQPLEYPSAGSVFKRPEGHFTGKLIQDSELQGVSVGGAQVSKKHAGFIINTGNATAKDVLDLISLVQRTVKEKMGVKLDTEVKIIGKD